MKKIFVFIALFVSITAPAQFQLRLAPEANFYSPTLTLKLEVNKVVSLLTWAGQPGASILGFGWNVGPDITPNPPEWFVNGIVNGNDLTGKIIMNMNARYDVTFKAPPHKPDKNPVTITAVYKDVHLNGRIFDTAITCHIEILGGTAIRLDPDSARLLCWSELPLRIMCDSNGYSSVVNGLYGRDGTLTQPQWTINGIVNGSASDGFIDILFPNTPFHSFCKPAKNPVEITATFKDVYLNGQYSDRKLTCYVDVVEGEWISRLNPDSAHLCVNDTLLLKLNMQYKNSDPAVMGVGQSHLELGWWVGGVTPNPPEWLVNGIPNGNDLTGKIIMNRNAPYNITFKAPSHKPDKNPVKITALYKDFNVDGRVFDTAITCHIWIVDCIDKSSEDKGKKIDTILVKNKEEIKETFEVKMVTSLKGGSEAAWGGVVTYSDEGSFRISMVGEKAEITDIKNNLEVLTNNCAKTIINPTTCTGMLHIAGTKQIKVTPAQPYPIVEIWFVQYPTELTRFTFDCPPPPNAKNRSKGRVDLTTGRPAPLMMFMGMPALPTYLKFIAKDEEQILIEQGKPGGEIYYKFSVRKLKDE